MRGGGADTTVTLTDTTSIQAVIGVLGARRGGSSGFGSHCGPRGQRPDTVQNGSELDAVKITFKPDDLKDRRMAAQAAMHPEQVQLQAARQKLIAAQAETERRLALVGQYDQKASTRVYFASGSTAINARGKNDLHAIAQQAAAIPGYSLRVVGHTDSTGSAALNQQLSNQRASVVTAYLLMDCIVPPEKFTAVAVVGSNLPLDSVDLGGAMKRRVAVFVLVRKDSEGVSKLPPAGAPDPSAPTPPQ